MTTWIHEFLQDEIFQIFNDVNRKCRYVFQLEVVTSDLRVHCVRTRIERTVRKYNLKVDVLKIVNFALCVLLCMTFMECGV